MSSSDWSESLERARQRYRSGLRDGTICPCCDRYGKIYKRKLNAGMARTMISFYRHNKKKPGWFHVLKDFQFEQSGPLYVCGDYSKLVCWGLIEESVDRKDDGNPDNGFYRITDAGVVFVENKIRVKRYVYLYNNVPLEPENLDEETVSIQECLGSEFNYNELMNS